MALRALLLFACVFGVVRSALPEGGRGGDAAGPAPKQNFSDIHAKQEWVQRAFAEAQRARASKRWTAAARFLMPVIEATHRPEQAAESAPYVRSAQGTKTYEGAWIAAQHALARGGDPLLDAAEAEWGVLAERLVARGLREARLRRDGGEPPSWVLCARRYLPLRAGRRSALLLIDAALERHDTDAALEWCEALEDLEAVTQEAPERLAPWRRARINRHARALAPTRGEGRDSQVKAIAAELTRRASQCQAPDAGLRALSRKHMPRPAVLANWATTGGDATRNATPPALGRNFELAWVHGPGSDVQLADTEDPPDGGTVEPSTWHPPRGAVMGDTFFVSDGEGIQVIDIPTGAKIGFRRFMRWEPLGSDVPRDPRSRFGWSEGHALTVVPWPGADNAGPGDWLLLAAVPDEAPWPGEHADHEEAREDHIEAFRARRAGDARRVSLEPLWEAGGGATQAPSSGALPKTLRLYSAPLVYRNKVWVGGVVPSRASRDRFEAWILALDPVSGALHSKTHVGTGTPVRSLREDEIMPTAPAGAHGRVVICTSLGLVGAVSARDGRVLWMHRYERNVEVTRGIRGRRRREDGEARSMSFVNAPPRLGYERCIVAPTDSSYILELMQRPIGPARMLEGQAIHWREHFDRFLPEQVLALAPNPEDPSDLWLILAGRGQERGRARALGRGALPRHLAPTVERVSHHGLRRAHVRLRPRDDAGGVLADARGPHHLEPRHRPSPHAPQGAPPCPRNRRSKPRAPLAMCCPGATRG